MEGGEESEVYIEKSWIKKADRNLYELRRSEEMTKRHMLKATWASIHICIYIFFYFSNREKLVRGERKGRNKREVWCGGVPRILVHRHAPFSFILLKLQKRKELAEGSLQIPGTNVVQWRQSARWESYRQLSARKG